MYTVWNQLLRNLHTQRKNVPRETSNTGTFPSLSDASLHVSDIHRLSGQDRQRSWPWFVIHLRQWTRKSWFF